MPCQHFISSKPSRGKISSYTLCVQSEAQLNVETTSSMESKVASLNTYVGLMYLFKFEFELTTVSRMSYHMVAFCFHIIFPLWFCDELQYIP